VINVNKAGTGLLLAVLLVLKVTASQADAPLQLLQELAAYPHAQTLDFVEQDILDYEVGLGAMQKVGGAWKFKHSERHDGKLTRYTWQIVDGFTSLEVMDELVGRVEQLELAELLFSCEGRACGKGVQWANRVFRQPLLYGRDDLQHYRVYSIGEDPGNLLIIFASARSADRQYLHTELLELD